MYEIHVENSAEKELRKIPVDYFKIIISKIRALSDKPYPVGCKKLKDKENFWRIRIGNYRVLYEIDNSNKSIKIYRVRHRKDAYK